jgi:NADH-quinone oxidoreductase subunit E
MVKQLPTDIEAKLKEVIERYPQTRSAVMPGLYLAQQYFGHITDEAVAWVADRLGMAPVQVWEVASFYTMYYKKPVGRYHIQVCRTMPCALRGAAEVTEHVKKRFCTKAHEPTADGLWSYEEVECLGSCGTAPIVQINDVFFENLTIEKLDDLIQRIEQELPDLRLNPMTETLGDGLKGCPRSEVI